MSFLTILIQDPPILDFSDTDSPCRLEVGSEVFIEIQSQAATGPFLGFYDWLRSSTGEIVGLRITFHDQRERAIEVLRQSHIGEWETSEIFHLMFFHSDIQVDETLSVDQEFSVSRIYSAPDGQVALLVEASTRLSVGMSPP
jgi:hypothetical protein